MKYLTLIRHAESHDVSPGQKDLERNLNRWGEINAPKMGVKLNELKLKPSKVYVSPATRTKQTSNLLVEQLDYPLGEVELEELLYDASVGSLLNFVNSLDDSDHDVTLIGHNPSISYLCEYLTGEVVGDVPTCGAVRMKFDVSDWSLVSKDLGDLIYFVYPKMLEAD